MGCADEVAPRDLMTLSLSFDHRLVDGQQASAFSPRWARSCPIRRTSRLRLTEPALNPLRFLTVQGGGAEAEHGERPPQRLELVLALHHDGYEQTFVR